MSTILTNSWNTKSNALCVHTVPWRSQCPSPFIIISAGIHETQYDVRQSWTTDYDTICITPKYCIVIYYNHFTGIRLCASDLIVFSSCIILWDNSLVLNGLQSIMHGNFCLILYNCCGLNTNVLGLFLVSASVSDGVNLSTNTYILCSWYLLVFGWLID